MHDGFCSPFPSLPPHVLLPGTGGSGPGPGLPSILAGQLCAFSFFIWKTG